MSAYIVLLRHETISSQELDTYAAAAKLARPGHDITKLAYYGEIEVLEGPATEGAVIFEFADMAAARAWYHSPLYQAAKLHRNLGANCSVLLVDGV